VHVVRRDQRATGGDLLRRYKTEVTPLKRGKEPALYRLLKKCRDSIIQYAAAKLSSIEVAAYTVIVAEPLHRPTPSSRNSTLAQPGPRAGGMVSCVVFLFEPSSSRVDHAERTVCMDFSTEERCLFGIPLRSTMGEVLEICRRVDREDAARPRTARLRRS